MSQQRIGITGDGWLSWHVACRQRALTGTTPERWGRATTSDPAAFDACIAEVDGVLHVAGVNRAGSDAEVEQGNVAAAEQLAGALRRAGRPVDVAYANSVQSDDPSESNAYGRGKRAAAEILAAACAETGGRFADVVLPNLFGEHGRPAYNSFVATFAHEVAQGREPSVTGDRPVPLLHAQAAAAALVDALGTAGPVRPAGEEHGVVEVLDRLRAMHALYAERGEVPPLTTRFEVDLFNTYRAAAFPAMWPLRPQVHGDARGDLFEAVRAHGGTGQAFVSSTVPGQKRGEHYHLHKVERFLVVGGEAEIGLRRLLTDEVVTFRLSGESPAFVDMPTLWVHHIRNVGDTELITVFWADQLLDPDDPDQYPEEVVR